jgi:hypothetical protein
MQRRRFLQSILWLGGGLLATKLSANGSLVLDSAHARDSKKRKLKGRVSGRGKGIKGVVVSDGYSVVITNDNGKYELPVHPGATNVFISTPAGYAFKNQDGITRHYRSLKNSDTKKSINFELEPLDTDDNEHQFVIWADPQVKNAKDVEKMMNQSVPDVQKWVAAAGTGALLHGITVGDIVWDELNLFADYNKAVSKMGIPFFQCLGNHDMDYNKGGDETSDATFQQFYGPTYYSFNRGKVHYVVMDDVRYLGKDRVYDGYMAKHQLDWLQKDLAFVPKDQLIVLCVHIPVHSGVKNNKELYALLEDRNVHIMSGHTHYHRNVIKGNIYEHNHGTVCGAWWTGAICGDGTPCGYGVYKVKGTELSWHYQSTGKAADHQLRITVNNEDPLQKQVQVNIWDYDPAWKTEYRIDGDSKGSLQQFEGFDPLAYKNMLGPELPKPRCSANISKTNRGDCNGPVWKEVYSSAGVDDVA